LNGLGSVRPERPNFQNRRFASTTRAPSLKYKVVDLAPNGGKANVRISIKTLGGRTVKTLRFTNKAVNVALTAKFRCRLARKTYRVYVYATDAAGNVQSKVGRNRLIVK